MTANVGVCGGRGIGGLGNEAKRNAKTDQLRAVPRHNVNKENENYEDTEPPPDTNLLCVPSMARLLSSREISLIIQRVQVPCVHCIDAH